MEGVSGKNITVKALALILAMVLWIYVTNEQNPPVETTLAVPLEVRNLGDSFVAVDAPDTVRVKVRGSRGIIAGLQPQDIQAFVDMRGLEEGRQSVKVHAQMPVSLELLEISPDRLQLRIDTATNRTLPVEIRITGSAAAGTSVAKASAAPQHVTIKGPKSLVDAADKAIVPLELAGKNADFTVTVAPQLLGRDGKPLEGLAVSPEKITVSANLVKGVNKKTIDVKTIIYGELAAGQVLRGIATQPPKIQISGDPQVVDKIDFVYTEPISIAGIDRDTNREVKLQLKEGVIASQNSVTVQIRVDNNR
ncbi:MAG TPA: CdaR family protein [Selenomonadales bacterium]|nr:CdaR family protein [Selenomonadales bacterium]